MEPFTDGDFSALTLVEPTRVSRPFANAPSFDFETKIYERVYEIDPARYRPATELSTLPHEGPGDDGADANAYLIYESPSPDVLPDGSIRVVRRWANVPPTQTDDGGSIMVGRPSPPLSQFPGALGDYRIFRPIADLPQFDAYLARPVTSDSGVPSFSLTGGTYVIPFAGATTAPIAYNAAASAVQSALNAITPVSARGGVVVSGAHDATDGFLVTFADYAACGLNLAGMLTGAAKSVVPNNGGYTQTCTIAMTGTDPGAASPGVSTSGLQTAIGGVIAEATDSGGGTGGLREISYSIVPDHPTPVSAYLNAGGITFAGGLSGTPWHNATYTGSATTCEWALTANSGTSIIGGTYTLSLLGVSIGPIAYNASAASVRSAIESALGVTLSSFSASYDSHMISGNATITNAITGGSYTLTLYGETTGAIAYNATSGAIANAVSGLSSVASKGAVTVSGSGLSATISIQASTTITGGSFTATIFGQTTAAIAYNALPETVRAAFNALSNVAARGGVTVSIAAGQSTVLNSAATAVAFTINFATPALNVDCSAITPSGSAATVTVADGGLGRTQRIVFRGGLAARTIYAASHQIAVGDAIYIKADAGYHALDGSFSAPDGNTITLMVSASAPWATATAITEVGKRTKRNYCAGSSPVPCTQITRYSLDPITPDVYEGADAAFMLAILAGNSRINIRVGDSTRWPSAESPVRSLTTTVVSANNL